MFDPFQAPRSSRLTIAGLMKFCAVAAVMFAIGCDPRLLGVFAILVPIVVAYFVWFVVLPAWLGRAINRGAGPWARRVFEWIVAAPSLFGGRWKLQARFQLISFELARGRYAEANAQCRAMLAYRLSPGLESKVRQSLADCLEGLDRPDEAAEERALAEACLARPDSDYMTCLARGKMLERRGAFDEAYATYRRGLAVSPDVRRLQSLFMLRLALAAQNAGRTQDAAEWADRVLTCNAGEANHRLGLEVGALAHTQLRHWDKAESYLELLRALQERRGGGGSLARAISMLANVKFVRGDLAGAYQTTLEAEKVEPTERHPLLVRANILYMQGRFEESLAVLVRARDVTHANIPAEERRIRAGFALTMARTTAELGRPDEAHALVEEASPDVAQDPKFGVIGEATGAWIRALRGQRQEALACLERAEERLSTRGKDREPPLIALAAMGKAALVLEEPARALTYWEQYLGHEPEPAFRPTGLYHSGECRRLLGDSEGARRAYREAERNGVETHWVQKARERLRSLPLPAGDLA
jgi:tetratricopeptide (TPR) repeat protein